MSDAYRWTLHGLTLRQMADAIQLSEIVDVSPTDVEAALQRGVTDGTVVSARAQRMITPAGRQLLDVAYPEWFAEQRSSRALDEALERFEAGVNKETLRLTTEWQTVEVNGELTTNEHRDAAYDGKVLDRIGAVYDKTVKVLAPFSQSERTVARFLDRLGAALDKADAGATDYVSGLRVDSFHTVWFQMHEHLLRMMGQERPE